MRRFTRQALGMLGFCLWSASSFAYTCVLSNSDGKDTKDIAKSCEALMNTMDATDLKLQAFNQCCARAGEYLKKNPIPCADAAKTLYRIKLGIAVCDQLKSPTLDYERRYCLNQMLYRIPDKKVLEIADKCSPTGGRAASGRKRQDAAGGAPDLHMDDEDFSKCQRARLAEYLDTLEAESKRSPANYGDCKTKP